MVYSLILSSELHPAKQSMLQYGRFHVNGTVRFAHCGAVGIRVTMAPTATGSSLGSRMRQTAEIFWNRDQRRLRAGWRVTIQLLLWLFVPALLGGLLGAPLAALLTQLLPALEPIAGRAVNFTLTLIGALGGTWLATRFLDHRPFRELGLYFDRNWWIDFSFGLVLGALLMALIFVVERVMGWIEVTGAFVVADDTPFAVAILGPLIVFVVVGITEELLARGYEIKNLAEGFKREPLTPALAVLLAWLFSSVLFGLLHMFNPNATWYSTLSLMFAGIFLGTGFVLTGSLAIPIGLHITWNLFQGNVFGFPVSGNDFTTVTFIAIRQGGPDLWTGGPFGPEAGLVGLIAMVLGSLLTVAWVQRRYGDAQIDSELAYYRHSRRNTRR